MGCGVARLFTAAGIWCHYSPGTNANKKKNPNVNAAQCLDRGCASFQVFT